MSNNCAQFSAFIFHCLSLVNPDSSFLMPKVGLRWHKLALNVFFLLLFISVFSHIHTNKMHAGMQFCRIFNKLYFIKISICKIIEKMI